MIDVHSHILPGIDDGSKSMQETLELIAEAKKAGFDAIISTSHYIEDYYEADEQKRMGLISEILNETDADIDIYLGSEIYISPNSAKLINESKASTINNTDYVLFETSLNVQPFNLYELIYALQSKKKKLILAHPERYSFVQDNPNIIYDLIERGILMQANYGSVIGRYGKNAQHIVRKLLKNNMIHLMGSDVHRANSIYRDMPIILSELRKIIGDEKVEELTSLNPEHILKNEEIEVDEPQKIKISILDKIMKRYS